MNWRDLIGSAVERAAHAVLSSPIMPLTRYVPPGLFWLYDIQRFAGTRNFAVVFDVGANVGQTAYGLIRYLPNSQIFCIEPVEATMKQLKRDYAKYKNIQFVQAAFGSKRETVCIPLHKNSVLNTLVKNQPRTEDLTGQNEMIVVETLDDFCHTNGIKKIDLLKLDVQGWELEVLRGAEGLIRRNDIYFVFAEVSFHKSDTDMQQFDELHEYMECNGFNFCGFYDTFRYGLMKEFVSFSNALYVNSAFTKNSNAKFEP